MNPPRVQFASLRIAAGRLALYLTLFALILGAKLLLIDRYASDLPYWDQWDAEGELLIRPYLESRLTLAHFFQPHNEHRPLFTRLLALGLFMVNDHQWDARLQMVVNAALHAACALLLLNLARRFLPSIGLGLFVILTALFFAMNVSWENTLAGFQSQFYFVLLFTCLHLGYTWLARPRSLVWWLAPLAGVANLFSMASGLLSAAAIVAVTSLSAARNRRLTRDDIFVLATNTLLVGAGWMLKNEIPGHAFLKAQDPGGWLDAWLHQLAWPVVTGNGPAWFAVIGLLPPLVLLFFYWRRQVDGPIALVLLSLCVWTVLQTMAIAYARGGVEHGYASRYADTLAFGVLVNLLALAFVVTQVTGQRMLQVALVLLVLIDLGGLWRESIGFNRANLQMQPELTTARVTSVREYLLHRPASFFRKTPWNELPYPSAKQLAYYLDKPVIRAALPASVRPPVALELDPLSSCGFSPLSSPSPAEQPPDGFNAWATIPGGPASLQSKSFLTDHTRITFFIKAEPSAAPVRLQLIDSLARTYQPLGEILTTDGRYKRVNFKAPAGSYRLELNKTGPGRLIVTQPYTDTPLSHWTVKAAQLGPWLLGIGMLLGVAAVVLQTRVSADRPANGGSPTPAA